MAEKFDKSMILADVEDGSKKPPKPTNTFNRIITKPKSKKSSTQNRNTKSNFFTPVPRASKKKENTNKKNENQKEESQTTSQQINNQEQNVSYTRFADDIIVQKENTDTYNQEAFEELNEFVTDNSSYIADNAEESDKAFADSDNRIVDNDNDELDIDSSFLVDNKDEQEDTHEQESKHSDYYAPFGMESNQEFAAVDTQSNLNDEENDKQDYASDIDFEQESSADAVKKEEDVPISTDDWNMPISELRQELSGKEQPQVGKILMPDMSEEEQQMFKEMIMSGTSEHMKEKENGNKVDLEESNDMNKETMDYEKSVLAQVSELIVNADEEIMPIEETVKQPVAEPVKRIVEEKAPIARDIIDIADELEVEPDEAVAEMIEEDKKEKIAKKDKKAKKDKQSEKSKIDDSENIEPRRFEHEVAIDSSYDLNNDMFYSPDEIAKANEEKIKERDSELFALFNPPEERVKKPKNAKDYSLLPATKYKSIRKSNRILSYTLSKNEKIYKTYDVGSGSRVDVTNRRLVCVSDTTMQMEIGEVTGVSGVFQKHFSFIALVFFSVFMGLIALAVLMLTSKVKIDNIDVAKLLVKIAIILIAGVSLGLAAVSLSQIYKKKFFIVFSTKPQSNFVEMKSRYIAKHHKNINSVVINAKKESRVLISEIGAAIIDVKDYNAMIERICK